MVKFLVRSLVYKHGNFGGGQCSATLMRVSTVFARFTGNVYMKSLGLLMSLVSVSDFSFPFCNDWVEFLMIESLVFIAFTTQENHKS
jgi:hypothetical protein